MIYFPMFMHIKGQEILICGGGKHAVEKIEKLQPFQPKIHVISENISTKIKSMQNITMAERSLSKEDLYAYPLFVIAAEDETENKRIAKLCRKFHIPVNAVDQPEDCDFIFPSMIATEQLCIGVSTGGVSPTGAICLKNRFADIIPDEIDNILLWVKSLKEKMKAEQIPVCVRNNFLRTAMHQALDKERILTASELNEIYKNIP